MRFRALLSVIVIGLSFIGWSMKAEATVITYDMSWTGVQGYSITGAFSYDDAKLPASQLEHRPFNLQHIRQL